MCIPSFSLTHSAAVNVTTSCKRNLCIAQVDQHLYQHPSCVLLNHGLCTIAHHHVTLGVSTDNYAGLVIEYLNLFLIQTNNFTPVLGLLRY